MLFHAQVLPFPGYREQAALGAIKRSLANVAIFVALDSVTSSTGPGEFQQRSWLTLMTAYLLWQGIT